MNTELEPRPRAHWAGATLAGLVKHQDQLIAAMKGRMEILDARIRAGKQQRIEDAKDHKAAMRIKDLVILALRKQLTELQRGGRHPQ